MLFHHIFTKIDTENSVFYAWFGAMHTRIDIALCNNSEDESVKLMEEIYHEVILLEQMTDRFNEQSEISKINRMAATAPFYVTPELYSIINDCIEYYKITLGAFDITVQSLNDYRQGINGIILDLTTSTVYFNNENIKLDLCGYVKGYALGKIKSILLGSNCVDALVNIGNSSVLGLGNHPNGNGWRVSLPSRIGEYVTLFNQCLTSSGNSSDHLHIKHPTTGAFAPPKEVISVITENAAHGEVLSTALCVCDPNLSALICSKIGGELP